VIIIWSGKAHLGVVSDAKTHGSLGAVDGALPQVVGDEEAVLGLETALRNYDAGGGN
jgi:hypothetical protein